MIMCLHTCTMKGLGWVGLHVRHFVEIMNEREREGGAGSDDLCAHCVRDQMALRKPLKICVPSRWTHNNARGFFSRSKVNDIKGKFVVCANC